VFVSMGGAFHMISFHCYPRPIFGSKTLTPVTRAPEGGRHVPVRIRISTAPHVPEVEGHRNRRRDGPSARVRRHATQRLAPAVSRAASGVPVTKSTASSSGKPPAITAPASTSCQSCASCVTRLGRSSRSGHQLPQPVAHKLLGSAQILRGIQRNRSSTRGHFARRVRSRSRDRLAFRILDPPSHPAALVPPPSCSTLAVHQCSRIATPEQPRQRGR